MSKTERQMWALIEALEDVPVSEEEAREEVARLGIDVAAMAARMRARVAAASEEHTGRERGTEVGAVDGGSRKDDT